MPVLHPKRYDGDMPLTYLITSRAVIWASNTRYATLFVNAIVEEELEEELEDSPKDPKRDGKPVLKDPKRDGKPVTEEQLTEFATLDLVEDSPKDRKRDGKPVAKDPKRDGKPVAKDPKRDGKPVSKDPKRDSKLVTEKQLTEFATMDPPAIASPSANVLRLYFDYDTSREEIMAKLTCVTSLEEEVLSCLRGMAQRYIFLTRR